MWVAEMSTSADLRGDRNSNPRPQTERNNKVGQQPTINQGGRNMPVCFSFRHQRMLKERTPDQVNMERSFGAKAFKHKKTKRKMARESRKINRAS